jgi:hypothetical protein
LAQRVGHPHAIGLSIWASGVAAYLVGHWKQAAELCEQAAEVLRDQCTGVTWELHVAHRFMLSAHLYLGNLAEVSRRVPTLLASALEQGNVFAATDLRTRMNLIWLAADNPDRARAEVIEALKAWPHEGFHLQHYSSMLALAGIELYTGDTEVALKHIQGQWRALQKSMLLRIQVLRVEAMHLYARAALANVASGNNRLQFAGKIARAISKERMRWADPLANLLNAAIAYQRGDAVKAATLLSAAAEGFDLSDMHLYAAAARRRLGQIREANRGRELIAEADSWMEKQKIKNPVLMTRMLAPGFD